MAFKKSSPELIELFSKIAPRDPAVDHRKMFGWPCCFIKGNMFTGLHQDSMVLRLSDDDRARFLTIEGSAEFEPMPGHKMREYVVVPATMLGETGELEDWVNASLDYAKSLPVKSKKKPAAKAKAAASVKSSKSKRK